MDALPFHAPSLLPQPSDTALKHHFLGRNLKDVQAPAVVLDAAVVRRNCKLMLDTAKQLDVGFRAHVKTHKTLQLTKLQVGEDSKSVKLIASTVAEIENLLPWLLECKKAGKEVNIIYGLPLSPSSLPRLSTLAHHLGPGTISLFADHPSHIALLNTLPPNTWPGRIPVLIKIDTGYHRAGVSPGQPQLTALAAALAASPRAAPAGFYSHMGHSYATSSPQEALRAFAQELEGLEAGARAFLASAGAPLQAGAKPLLSLGATPTATAAQNLLHDAAGGPASAEYRSLLSRVSREFSVELHAGVYPVLDLQQLATRARPAESRAQPGQSLLSLRDLGLRALVEVVSVYEDREKPEAMIAAGSIALGREPCKSYGGWGVVSSWGAEGGEGGGVFEAEGERRGWIVGRISQEHGVLVWEGEREGMRELRVGEKLLVWPNHACMCGPGFGWYLVVDSEAEEGPDVVVDVWTRWRGW